MPNICVVCRWFHFRLTGAAHQNLTINLVNAGQSSFPEAWPGYRACASYDLKEWFRVKTIWDEKAGVITIKHKPLQNSVYFAYFTPYSYHRHQELIAATHVKKGVSLEILGPTLDGHDLDLLRVGKCCKVLCYQSALRSAACLYRLWLMQAVLSESTPRVNSCYCKSP